MPLAPGLTGESRVIVDQTNTAAAVGSGGVDVFSTPNMIGLMEMASHHAVQPELAPGQVTVGTRVEVNHLAATPLGMQVVAKATLLEVDGRRLVFAVEAFDDTEKVGEGRHERYIVNLDKFLARTAQKAQG